MAKKQTPEELRKQAKTLIDKAKKLEAEKHMKIGKYVANQAKNSFKDFEYFEEFKAKIREVME